MRINPDSEETAATTAFGDLVASLGTTDPDHLDAARLRTVSAALARDGWLEVATDGTFTLLCALAERAGAGGRPFAHPLLEGWLARRILAALPDPPAVAAGEVLTVAVDLLCGNDTGASAGAVPFGGIADTVLVPVVLQDGSARVHHAAPGALPLAAGLAVDRTVPTRHLERSAVDAPVAGVLPAAEVRRLAAEYLCLQACEIAGIVRVLLDSTVAHLRSRRQFGSLLASFQALQHRAADLLVDVESVRSLASHAGWAVEVGAPSGADYALTAKGFAGERGIEIANGAIQLHGGIGFTWEAGLHWGANRIAYRAVTGRHASDALHEAGLRAVARGGLLPGISPVVAVGTS
ncbi:acyl-CoA dehydrogenase family protein [Actinophytocola sediminis]